VKLLFVMDSPEYLRFFDSVVEELAKRGHLVIIGVNGDSGKKPVGLEGLQSSLDRVTVLGVVPQPSGRWYGVARGLRGTMDFVRFLHPRFAAAPALRARMRRKALPAAYAWIDGIPRVSPGTVHAAERVLGAMEQAIPVSEPIERFLKTEAPDVLIVSPLVAAASDQVDWIKAARATGTRSVVSIASWDNLTNKGLMRIEPDLVMVWNEAQKQEACEYHHMPAEKVAVTGAQLFDRWFARRITRERDVFCNRAGLRDAGPFLLFTGSSSFISNSDAEVAFVRRWVEALRASTDPGLRDVNILIRPHPYNCHRWASDPLADLAGVSVFPRTGYSPVDPDNRDDFFDTLSHCAAVVGINTSAMIEAAIVGRPVFSILAAEFAGTQEGTVHFHHLLPEHGGFVRLAPTLHDHIAQLTAWRHDPAAAERDAERFIASFIRPHGVDRPATPLFADVIERLGALPAPRPRRAPAWTLALRPLLLAAAVPVPVVAALRRPGAADRARRQVDRLVYTGHKRASRTVRLARDRAQRILRKAGKRWRRALSNQRARVR
jgi:hypothetical protein